MEKPMELQVRGERSGFSMLFSDLKSREIINICTGERYGNVSDLEFDPCTGTVLAVIVPGSSRPFGFFKGREGMAIPFSKIKKLGEDVILVELP